MYETKLNKSEAKYSFGKDKKFKGQNNETPGPGQYKIPCSIVDVNEYTRAVGKYDSTYKFV